MTTTPHTASVADITAALTASLDRSRAIQTDARDRAATRALTRYQAIRDQVPVISPTAAAAAVLVPYLPLDDTRFGAIARAVIETAAHDATGRTDF